MKKLEFTLEDFRQLHKTQQQELIKICLEILGFGSVIVINESIIKTKDELHDFQITNGIVFL